MIKSIFLALLFVSNVSQVLAERSLAPSPQKKVEPAATSPKAPAPSAALKNLSRDGAKIAIVVNKDVITHQDIQDRAMLALLTSGMPTNDPKLLESVKDQVKSSLIDEKIQLQAAKEQKIFITAAEIKDAISNIAKDNNMTVEQMKSMFQSQGIPVKTLENRLNAQIAWARTIREAFGGGFVHITDKDVSAELEKIKQNLSKPQYELMEIFLRVDDTSKEGAVKRDADKIYQQLKAGAHFRALAQQFSQGTASTRGGYIGWMVKGQMDPAIESVVETLKVGDFSAPVRVGMGYKIILLKDIKRPGETSFGQTRISYQQVAIPYHESMSPEEQQKAEADIQQLSQAKSCNRFSSKAKECGYQCEAVSKQSLNAIPESLQKLLQHATAGMCLKPIRTESHVVLCMVCQKESAVEKLPTTEEIKNALEQEKLGKIAMREFNKLRSVAFIEDKIDGSASQLRTNGGQR